MQEELLKEKELKLLEQLKIQRERCGFSQRGLCAIIDMKQPSLVKIEKGLSSPQLNTLLKILEPLGLTIEFVPLKEEKKDGNL